MTASIACCSPPAPYGEALFVVDTDVAVPARVDRLRIDVLARNGAVLATREVATPTRAEWPVSFSVVGGDDAEHAAFVRLRAYPEGHVVASRDLGGDAGAAAPEPAPLSIEAACREPPELRLELPLPVRRGATPITSVLPYTTRDGSTVCSHPTRAGSAVARFTAPDDGTYVFEIVRATPDGAHGDPGGDTTLSLRRECLFPTAQIACADDISPLNRLSKLTVFLPAGTYFVVTGGAEPAAADLVLLASRTSTAQVVPGSPPRGTTRTDREPAPGVTIDRLVEVALPPSARGTIDVVLHGECFGSAADLVGLTTCVDRADTRVTVVPASMSPGLRRSPAAPAPAWQADAVVPCTLPPRPASPTLDEEACIPGGVFVLGDMLALTDGDFRTQPERVRIVEPFLLDRFEVTVGRYRDALRRGYVPVAPPDEEPGPLRGGHVCTWSVGSTPLEPAPGIDRETFPLNCVSWVEARAFCNFAGGDLPSEEAYEYAATAAGRRTETPYPWGTDLPTCEATPFARGYPPFDLSWSGVRTRDVDEANWCTFGPPDANAGGILLDDLPLSCVSWATARAYCQELGKDLPTEAEFEYVSSGLGAEWSFPWGEAEPTCGDAVWGRGGVGLFELLPSTCRDVASTGWPGYPGTGAADRLSNDVLGNGSPEEIVDVAGNLGEWMLDVWARQSDSAWRSLERVVDPRAAVPSEVDGDARVARGGDWTTSTLALRGGYRVKRLPSDDSSRVGFRCRRRGNE